ncbi:TNF receptor-associated factor 4-like [Orbicella faveolata]|uniref:TNF receptor-associated factor 4-like n=1 Tax=Orbicella faveolata TaxID=48498 RepID=UPI0009E45991|nr:TNF receptor-associated factor 4-like [Orbicella faveolata]
MDLNQDLDVFPDKATERKILSFFIKCPSEGCDWTGELRNKKNHLATCSCKIVSCLNKNCDITMQRKNLKLHMTTTCQWRIIQCEHCSEPHPKCQMEDHIKECLKFPLPCPNICGVSIPREKIPDHATNDCPLTLIPCPYEQIGCKRKVNVQVLG